ncbi:hypothetical protein [Haliangium sp.]|uniref:hypothetical protein n=1 Tax=Haliangium sp. TaxID=2663208 RepID=UPI003D10C997
MSPAKRRRRRRRRLLISGVVVTFVLVFGWIGVIVLLQIVTGDNEKSFREESLEILQALDEGRAEEVYRAASPALHRSLTRDRFLEIATDMARTNGHFREILNQQVAERIDGPGGPLARVSVTLAYERGRVSGQLSFHETEGRWRLLGLGLGLPVPPRGSTASATPVDAGVPTTDAGPELLPAPAPVLEQFERILVMIDEGRAGDIYEAASPHFQAGTERARFEAVMSKRRSVLGRYLAVNEMTRAVQNRARDRASVEARVGFRNHESKVIMRFMRQDNAWQLTSLLISLPGPEIPRVSPNF